MTTLRKSLVLRVIAERLAPFGLLVLGSVAAGALRAAEANFLPVPLTTIYPGEAIRESSVVDREFPSGSSAFANGSIERREMIVGKIARRTLLPGTPIPWNAVMEPKVVSIGAKVRVVFEEGAVSIKAYGSALQSGSVGDVVSVRNLDSGVTISGTVQADGSVRVSGG